MEIIINAIEALIIFYLLRHVLISVEKDFNKQILGILGVIFIANVLNIMKIDTNIIVIFMMLTITLFAYFCFRGERFQRIFWGCSYVMIAAIADKVTFHAAMLLGHENLNLLMQPSLIRFQMSFIYLLTSFTIVLFLIHMKNSNLHLPRKFEFLMVFFIVIGIITLGKLMDYTIYASTISASSHLFSWIDSIYLFVLASLLIMWYLIKYLAKTYHERNILKEEKQLQEHELKEYNTMKNSLQTLCEWKHDYKNQLIYIQSLSQQKKYVDLNEYISNTIGASSNSIHMPDTGNMALDSVISMKLLQAEKQGVKIQYKTYLAEQLSVDDLDLISIIGNLLDNAIEACLHLSRPEQGYINLTVKPYKRMMCIEVENSSDGNYIMEKEQLKSRKKKDGHGIGLIRVEQIIKKTNGFSSYCAKPDFFRYTILLPVKVASEKKE